MTVFFSKRMGTLMANQLVVKKCQPCGKGVSPLSVEESQTLITQVPGWFLSADGRSLWREFVMKNFLSAVQFINQISEVAEKEDHHPDLHLTGYRKLRIELATHLIGGLSENDFILAAKIDELPKELKKSA
jgi:4a-hydroxytetrahydrobiopterin dehydratase